MSHNFDQEPSEFQKKLAEREQAYINQFKGEETMTDSNPRPGGYGTLEEQFAKLEGNTPFPRYPQPPQNDPRMSPQGVPFPSTRAPGFGPPQGHHTTNPNTVWDFNHTPPFPNGWGGPQQPMPVWGQPMQPANSFKGNPDPTKNITDNEVEVHTLTMVKTVCDQKKLFQLTETQLDLMVKQIANFAINTLTYPVNLLSTPESVLQEGVQVLRSPCPQNSFLLWLNRVGKDGVVKALKENHAASEKRGWFDNSNKTFIMELKRFIDKPTNQPPEEFLSLYRSLMSEIIESGLDQ